MADDFRFWTPATWQDFGSGTPEQDSLNQLWNTNLNGFTQQGICGNPWNEPNASGISNYFNPIDTPMPADTAVVQIEWPAFPGRITAYNPSLTPEQVLELGDTGYMQVDGKQETFPPIQQNPCTGAPQPRPYGPYGPRGWQDEYCEWSVQRDPKTNKILRVDIVCENPEYWNSLWMIDPQKVLTAYQTTLGKSQIQLEDLCLTDSNGNVVTDPSTGRPAYNPLNKWNSGPVSTDTAGGAMHLTSTPNTLQTEIGLASAATIQRTSANYTNPNGLICCAQYGQIYRNSDPHIGAMVNGKVSSGLTVTLANPPGLYIQEPTNWSAYSFPEGDQSSWWTVARGYATANGEDGKPLPGNLILHAVFAPPAGSQFTVSDVSINGQPINWAGQIIQTLNMQILAAGFSAPVPTAVGCSSAAGGPDLDQPLQLFHQAVFCAMNGTKVPNVVGQPMTLVSNSTLIAPMLPQSGRATMVLTAALTSTKLPSVTFDDDDITGTVTGSFSVSYAVPGNTYPSQSTALVVDVAVSPSARTGLRGVSLNGGPVMPALLNVLAIPGNGDARIAHEI
ncbi:MAG TPA: hypothetical protein VEQ63_14960 [Bryobacteraceae bacterium]|nr:hypothetical protein [Bryobacteraceae bacterium]